MSTTTNPRHPSNQPSSADPGIPQEPTGPIAADSLAAESLRSGGDFAANDPNAVPLGVPGSKSTLNTTDTSAATSLPPAADGVAREKLNAKGLGSDEKGVAGIKYPEGAGRAEFEGKTTVGGEYYGGPSGAGSKSASSRQAAGASDFGATTSSSGTTSSTSGGITSSQPSATGPSTSTSTSSPSTSATAPTPGAGIRPHVPAALTYAARVSGAISNANELQPKGNDLTEGGDVPEGKKTFVGAVTGPNDPGRLGEEGFERVNAAIAGGGVVGGGAGKEGEEGAGQFGALGSERI